MDRIIRGIQALAKDPYSKEAVLDLVIGFQKYLFSAVQKDDEYFPNQRGDSASSSFRDSLELMETMQSVLEGDLLPTQRAPGIKRKAEGVFSEEATLSCDARPQSNDVNYLKFAGLPSITLEGESRFDRLLEKRLRVRSPYEEFKTREAKFRQYVNFSPEQFDVLVKEVSHLIEQPRDIYGKTYDPSRKHCCAVSTQDRLFMLLWGLQSGDSFEVRLDLLFRDCSSRKCVRGE